MKFVILIILLEELEVFNTAEIIYPKYSVMKLFLLLWCIQLVFMENVLEDTLDS